MIFPWAPLLSNGFDDMANHWGSAFQPWHSGSQGWVCVCVFFLLTLVGLRNRYNLWFSWIWSVGFVLLFDFVYFILPKTDVVCFWLLASREQAMLSFLGWVGFRRQADKAKEPIARSPKDSRLDQQTLQKHCFSKASKNPKNSSRNWMKLEFLWALDLIPSIFGLLSV